MRTLLSAYITDDERYDYYIFKCTVAPKQSDGNKVFHRDGNDFPVKDEEWYCEGVWLDKVPTTSNWHVVTGQKCVVRMQVVVDANLELSAWSEGNDFPPRLNRQVANDAKEKGALQIEDGDHTFLMEVARQRTSLDYEQTIYGTIEDGDGGNAGSDDEDEYDS